MLFLALALAAAGSAAASPLLWTASLAAMLAVMACGGERGARGATPLALAVAAYVAWTVANGLFNSPYTAAAIYHPAFLAAGFLAARRLDDEALDRLSAVALGGMALLAAWALWQALSGQGRAHAHFETPNTLASVLNLGLAPLLFRIAYGEARTRTSVLAVFLLAALVATLSRGGFIALVGALLASAFWFAASPSPAKLRRLAAVVALGIGLGVAALQVPHAVATSSTGPAGIEEVGSTLGATLASRAELYRLALSRVGGHVGIGIGYLGFGALLESQRAQVPSYAAENVTYFVHNDYLQTLLELGAPGLLALMALVALPFFLVKRRRANEANRLCAHAALAGVATMAIHALGDFPFYVPLCLLVFGALLGEIDRRLAAAPSATAPAAPPRLARLGVAVALAWLLLPPPLAEAAAMYGAGRWQAGKGEAAAYGFELARRLQPRDWRYHWYAGQFWLAQARQGNASAAPLADAAFAAAMEANPAQAQPILGRLAVQLGFARALAAPQPAAVLRGWAERALALAPLNPAVRRDHAAALAQLEARR